MCVRERARRREERQGDGKGMRSNSLQCFGVRVHANRVGRSKEADIFKKRSQIDTQADHRQTGRDREGMSQRQDQADGRIIRWERERERE